MPRLPASARAVPWPPASPPPPRSSSTPAGICADASNNLFIADSGNNRVVRIDAVTGLLTLVTGTGTASSSGDGGPAAAASVSHPMGVALDSAGNLFISESQGNRIRRVDAQTGVITTIAGTGISSFGGDGGPATSAAFNLPGGIAFDSTGALYVADMGNNRVRRIDALTGLITTVAGDGSSIVGARRSPRLLCRHGETRSGSPSIPPARSSSANGAPTASVASIPPAAF